MKGQFKFTLDRYELTVIETYYDIELIMTKKTI